MGKENKRIVVRGILVVLLVAAIINVVFIRYISKATISMLSSRNTTVEPSGGHPSFAPMGWRGEVVLVKSPGGGYDLIVEAYAKSPPDTPINVDSAEVDIRRSGSGKAEMLPKLESQQTGKFVGHVDFPSMGEWEVRVRLHQGLQTMEFAEKFTLKAT